MRTSATLGITVQGVTFKCRSAMATDFDCSVGGSWEFGKHRLTGILY